LELQLEFITGQDKNGEDIIEIKTFVAKSPKARLVRRATELTETIDFSHFTPETLDMAVDFLTEIYKGKVTRDEIYDGLDSEKLLTTFTESIQIIINGVTSRLATFPEE